MIPISHIPLFIEPIKFDCEKNAEFKLSDNINNWETEIITHINEELPYLAKVPYEIQMKQMDKELGYALGSIVLKIEGAKAAIPLIIKKRKLASLDVLMQGEDVAMPLNEGNILELVQKKQKMGKLITSKTDSVIERNLDGNSGYAAQMPPNQGKYAFTTITAAKAQDIKKYEELINEKEVLAAFMASKANPTIEFRPMVKKASGIKKVAGNIIKKVDSILPSLEKTGSVLVVDIKNNLHKGLFIDNVQTLDGVKLAHKLFISDKVYAYQEKIAGKAGSFKVSGETDYSINDEVVFIINGVATEPVKVASKLNGEKLACINHLGKGFNVYLANVNDIVKTAAGYMIPKNATIIKLGKRVVVRANDEALVKMASAKGNKTYITCRPESNSFENEKLGTFNNLSDYRMSQLMNGFYSNGEDLLTEIKKTGSAVLSGISIESFPDKKTPPNVLSMTDTVKLAANLTDSDSVDAVLSLGFINEDNVQEFVEMVPQFEECVNHLAKVLVSIRLGMAGDQNVVKYAMKYMQRVIDGLKGLR